MKTKIAHFDMNPFEQKIILDKLSDLESRWKIKIWNQDVNKIEDNKSKHSVWLEKEFEIICK